MILVLDHRLRVTAHELVFAVSHFEPAGVDGIDEVSIPHSLKTDPIPGDIYHAHGVTTTPGLFFLIHAILTFTGCHTLAMDKSWEPIDLDFEHPRVDLTIYAASIRKSSEDALRMYEMVDLDKLLDGSIPPQSLVGRKFNVTGGFRLVSTGISENMIAGAIRIGLEIISPATRARLKAIIWSVRRFFPHITAARAFELGPEQLLRMFIGHYRHQNGYSAVFSGMFCLIPTLQSFSGMVTRWHTDGIQRQQQGTEVTFNDLRLTTDLIAFEGQDVLETDKILDEDLLSGDASKEKDE